MTDSLMRMQEIRCIAGKIRLDLLRSARRDEITGDIIRHLVLAIMNISSWQRIQVQSRFQYFRQHTIRIIKERFHLMNLVLGLTMHLILLSLQMAMRQLFGERSVPIWVIQSHLDYIIWQLEMRRLARALPSAIHIFIRQSVKNILILS